MRISVPLYALALTGGVALGVVFVSALVFFDFGGESERVRIPTKCPPPWGPEDFPCSAEGPLAARQWRNGLGVRFPLIAARVIGPGVAPGVRYVLQADPPGLYLTNGQMSTFLYVFRFGVRGRPMRVRLLDHKGFAWAAEYDGVYKISVSARPELTGCRPMLFVGGDSSFTKRRLPPAAGPADPPPCPLERLG